VNTNRCIKYRIYDFVADVELLVPYTNMTQDCVLYNILFYNNSNWI